MYTRIQFAPPSSVYCIWLDEVHGAVTAENYFKIGRCDGRFCYEDDVGCTIIADVFGDDGAIVSTSSFTIHNEDFMLG